jgi:hypothetical protein
VHGFDLPDLIRVNQLVRHRIDFKGFRAWFTDLPFERRRALTCLLCEFAYQAGVSIANWDESLSAIDVPATDPVVEQLCSLRQSDHPLFALFGFLEKLPAAELPVAFKLFVYLFGVAESRAYRSESKEHCNHWWHRDLLDKRVVRDLLTDPRFYVTNRKDDDRVKGQA